MWFIWPWALLPKKKKDIKEVILDYLKTVSLHLKKHHVNPLYLLVSFKEHCSSIPVSVSAVYRCLECPPFWCYFRRSAFHSKSYSKDPKIVPAKNVRFSVISHHKRVKLQDFANVQNRKRSSFGWCTTSGDSGSCSHVWLCSSRWRSRSSSRFTFNCKTP